MAKLVIVFKEKAESKDRIGLTPCWWEGALFLQWEFLLLGTENASIHFPLPERLAMGLLKAIQNISIVTICTYKVNKMLFFCLYEAPIRCGNWYTNSNSKLFDAFNEKSELVCIWRDRIECSKKENLWNWCVIHIAQAEKILLKSHKQLYCSICFIDKVNAQAPHTMFLNNGQLTESIHVQKY